MLQSLYYVCLEISLLCDLHYRISTCAQYISHTGSFPIESPEAARALGSNRVRLFLMPDCFPPCLFDPGTIGGRSHIPVGYAPVEATAVVAGPMLQCEAPFPHKRDAVGKMQSIAEQLWIRTPHSLNRIAGERSIIPTNSPSIVDIVLGSGAVECQARVIIYKKHLVPLSCRPVRRRIPQVDVKATADEMP